MIDVTYDVQDPQTYGSQGNRLMQSATCQGASSTLLEERFYSYSDSGLVTYVVVKRADDVDPGDDRQWYTGTQIWYNTQGLVWLAWEVRWKLTPDGQQVDFDSEQDVAAMEYRYEGPRSRYRVQARDAVCDANEYITNNCDNPNFLKPLNGDPSGGKWSDYDGDSIHGDFTVAVSGASPNQTATATHTMAHAAGLAQADMTGGTGVPPVNYIHGNLVGTTAWMTNAGGAIVHRAVYTAFGEPIDVAQPPSAVNTRYGYAGAYGYQASPYTSGDPLADLGWLHVGARYYDPTSGRFVQRDPIGIAGGLNTYVYCGNNPAFLVDPSGLDFFGGLFGSIGGGALAGAGAGALAGLASAGLPGLIPGAILGAAYGAAYGALAELAQSAYLGCMNQVYGGYPQPTRRQGFWTGFFGAVAPGAGSAGLGVLGRVGVSTGIGAAGGLLRGGNAPSAGWGAAVAGVWSGIAGAAGEAGLVGIRWVTPFGSFWTSNLVLP